MIEIDQKTALAAGKDRAGETLLQLIERFSDGNTLMGGVEKAAPASAFDPGQIIQGDPHFDTIFENFQTKKRWEPEISAPEHGAPEMLSGYGLCKETGRVEHITVNGTLVIARAEKQGTVGTVIDWGRARTVQIPE